jgi:hypothetical protein
VSNIDQYVTDLMWKNVASPTHIRLLSVTESVVLPPDLEEQMVDSSFYRDKAEQAFRLARESTDPVLIESLNEMAREYIARADALDGVVLGEDPKDDE